MNSKRKKNSLFAAASLMVLALLSFTLKPFAADKPLPNDENDIILQEDGIKGLKLNAKFPSKPPQGGYYATARLMGGNSFYDVYRLIDKNGWTVLGYAAVDKTYRTIAGLYFTNPRVVTPDGLRVEQFISVQMQKGLITGSISSDFETGKGIVRLSSRYAAIHPNGKLENLIAVKKIIDAYNEAPFLVDESDGSEYKMDIPLTPADCSDLTRIFALEIGFANIDYEYFTKIK